MTSRDRVPSALNSQPTDRLPKDPGAMRSTGISCFAYPKLVDALGLPPRRPRIHDTHQMLALPDLDVLDALGCDVVTMGWRSLADRNQVRRRAARASPPRRGMTGRMAMPSY